MRRLILPFVLLLFMLVSCDSPVGDPGGSSQEPDLRAKVASGVTPGTPPAQADSIRQAAWNRFRGQHGPVWRVTWNEKTGIPLTLFSGTSKNPYPGPPEQAARAFLKEQVQLLGMRGNLSDLKLDRIHRLHDVTHVRFRQTYNDIPVWEGGYVVHLRSDGRVDMANGNYYPSVEAPTSAGISGSAARQRALSDLGTDVTLAGEIKSELVVYPVNRGESFLPAWRIVIPAQAPVGGDWQYFVDAGSGTIVEKLNLATSVVGEGEIIEDHPDLTPSPVNRDFYRLDGSGYLRGTFANVHNDKNNRAFSSVNNFQFSTTSTHFDEANVYWHIDTYRADYLDNLGFTSDIGSDQDLEAWVHDVTVDPDNARYLPDREEVRFGDLLEFAKEDKIIYHEFNHAVQDVINSELESSTDQEGAITEGTADYFAGSYTGRPRIVESITNDEDIIRDMEDPKIVNYDQFLAESPGAHDGGELIAAVLWDLRSVLGSSTTDFLAFDALARVSGDPTFIEYRDAMLAADDAAFGGTNNDQIQNTFANRGIGEPAPPPAPDVSVTGTDNMFEGSSDTFTANVSGGSPPYSYQWYFRHESESNWTAAGINSDTYNHTAGSPNGEYIRVVVTDSYPVSSEDTHFITITGSSF